MFKKMLAVAMSALLLSACASSLSGDYAEGKGKTVMVPKEVWGWYEDYVTKISGVNKGLMVVGVKDDVAVSYSAYYCPGTKCMFENIGKKAIDDCQRLGGVDDCILFARSATILVNYKRLDQ